MSYFYVYSQLLLEPLCREVIGVEAIDSAAMTESLRAKEIVVMKSATQ